VSEAERLANLALAKRGYLVLAHRMEGPIPCPVPGEAFPVSAHGSKGPINGPFSVKQETDVEDMNDQARFWGFDPQPEPWGTWRYFRVVAE
jgi:hypothetical protein